jgi:F0F1-type ATP synthase assembly protein I
MTDPGQGRHERDAQRDAEEGAASDAATSRSLGRRAASAYQGAIEAVIAVVITTGAGYWLDQRFETSPTFLFVGLGIGFCSFVLRLWRLRPLMEPPPGTPSTPAVASHDDETDAWDEDRDEDRDEDPDEGPRST